MGKPEPPKTDRRKVGTLMDFIQYILRDPEKFTNDNELLSSHYYEEFVQLSKTTDKRQASDVFPANFISFMTDGKLYAHQISDPSARMLWDVHASCMIVNRFRLIFDPTVIDAIASIFGNRTKVFEDYAPGFFWWMRDISRTLMSITKFTFDRRNIETSIKTMKRIDELRDALCAVAIKMNAAYFPYNIYNKLNMYPTTAINLDRLFEVTRFIQSVAIRETGYDLIRYLDDSKWSPFSGIRDELIVAVESNMTQADAVTIIHDIVDRYKDTPLFQFSTFNSLLPTLMILQGKTEFSNSAPIEQGQRTLLQCPYLNK